MCNGGAQSAVCIALVIALEFSPISQLNAIGCAKRCNLVYDRDVAQSVGRFASDSLF
jgi:hypothetical protein